MLVVEQAPGSCPLFPGLPVLVLPTLGDMPEVYVLGQILGASDFGPAPLRCRWQLVVGDEHWKSIQGETEGQTHLVLPEDDGEFCVWSHPLETHYSTSGIEGWPQLTVQVWTQDEHKRNEIAGYGCCRIPTAPGMHELDLVTWAPEGGLVDRIAGALLGGKPQLKHPEVVTDAGVDRCALRTVTSGTVHLEFQVLTKGFAEHGVTFRAPTKESDATTLDDE